MADEVELFVGSQSLKVDKKILRKYSDYFDAMFSSAFAEDSCQQIKLQNMHYRSLKVIVDYMYSGRLALNSTNIENVYLTADFLQIKTVKSRCEELLPKHLDGYNCISIYNIAKSQDLRLIETAAIMTMLKCFEQLFEDKDFLKFRVELLITLLCDMDLNISDELIVYETVKRWINHDPYNRLRFKKELMMCLKVELLSHHHLAKIFCSEFMKTEIDIKTGLKNKLVEFNDKTGRVRHERLGMIINRIYVIGGLSNKKVDADKPGEAGRIVEVICPKHKTGATTTKLLYNPSPQLFGAAAVCVDNVVYVIGGNARSSSSSYSKQVWRFYPHTQVWEECSPLPTPVQHLAVCCCDKKVYAIGGYETMPDKDNPEEKHLTPSNRIQIYDTVTNTWTEDCNAADPRLLLQLCEARAHSCSVGMNSGGGLPGRVYVLGGYGTHKLSSVELISEGVVSPFPPMLRARHAFAAGLVGGMIVVVGGWGDRTVERFDFRNKQWGMMSNFPRYRDCIQGAVCDGYFYVFGGTKSEKHVPTVELYDFELDKWRTVVKLHIPRLYSSCAVT